jgi:transketolase
MSTSAQPQPATANIDQVSINTIPTLAMDGVQQANSGHPEYRWTSGIETTTPLKELQKKFGFTPDAVVAAANEETVKAVGQ